MNSVLQLIVEQNNEVDENNTNTKLAKLEGTNRTYIVKAKKLKRKILSHLKNLKKMAKKLLKI